MYKYISAHMQNRKDIAVSLVCGFFSSVAGLT